MSPPNSVLAAWHPVTHDFGLIQAPIEKVVAELRAWHASFGTQYSRTDVAKSLADAFESLLPLANSKMRKLLVETDSDWVAFYQNGIQGSDPFPPMAYLSGLMGVQAMRVCTTPTESDPYPATMWELYAPPALGGDRNGIRRSMAVAKDGGWEWVNAGEPFPFEQTDKYQLRRKRDRFTAEMLRDYLKNFGIRLFEDDFLRVDQQHPAIRLQQITNVWHTPEFTLAEVIAGKPWRR